MTNSHPSHSGRAARFLLLLGTLSCAYAAFADAQPAPLAETTPTTTPYKLTTGFYRFSGGANGVDVNLRHSSDYGNLWVGYYQSNEQHEYQWRTGWDRSFGETVRISPSLQVASHGFVGGSLQVETGERWFVGAGLGRTNLKPYWNLNFDPNDSYTLSGGYRGEDGQTFALQYVRDNRQNPDQRHLHFYWRQPLADRQRLTVDLLYKEGKVDDAMIHRWGASLTYDWPRYFVRLAYDPKANFGPDNLWRLSVGTRF